MSSTGDSCNSLTSKLITELLWRFILGKLISFHKRLHLVWKMTNCGHGVMWRTKQPALISVPCLQGTEEKRGIEIEQGENWARTSDAVMKPSSAPAGSSSDKPHRWLSQIKTQRGYKDYALNEGIHSVVCQTLSPNCNMEDILKSCTNMGLVAGSFLWFKPRWLVVLKCFFWFICDVLFQRLVVVLELEEPIKSMFYFRAGSPAYSICLG